MKKFLLCLSALCVFTPLWAGFAPKPQMDFTLVYQTQDKPAILPQTSEQIQCSDNQCLQAEPLGQYGIQKLYCRTAQCFSVAYAYEPFQQLVLSFADGTTRSSNVFPTPTKLRSNFTVLVREADLIVTPATAPQRFNALLRADAWSSLIIILLLEIVAAWMYLKYTHTRFRVLYSVLLVNLISMPFSWQVLGPFVADSCFIWLFCLVFEALLIWLLNRRYLSARAAFELSFAMNVTSYTVGMILSFLIAPYLL